MGIASAALDLANQPAGEGFLEKLFALDRQFHPGGVMFVYMVPHEDKIRVNLNGPFIYDAKFFLPKSLHMHARIIRTIYFHLINDCQTRIRRLGVSLDDRYNVDHYAGLVLDISAEQRDLIRRAVIALEDYFRKPHVAANA